MATSSLTETLLALPATQQSYQRATQHRFLAAAGALTLSADALQRWLTQDRLYALIGYSAFLGTLIARTPAPLCGPDTLAGRLHRRRLTVLAGAMANIDREVGFFEQTARDNGLDLAATPTPSTEYAASEAGSVTHGLVNPVTRGYIDYMVATASRGTFEEGMVLLWAMEKLYLDAWTFAKSKLPATASAAQEPGAARALLQLIPNWSSPEFAQFVQDIGELVDGLEVPSLTSVAGQRLVDVWTATLWFEERFWNAGV